MLLIARRSSGAIRGTGPVSAAAARAHPDPGLQHVAEYLINHGGDTKALKDWSVQRVPRSGASATPQPAYDTYYYSPAGRRFVRLRPCLCW